uniref:HAT C-terminal dimerisation domain-containing protein n=1 Tax=Latimeria chalumnae TaxID=7897 RepID=H3A637_LATCH
YHRFAQEQADMFIKSIRSGDMNVINQVDQHWKKQAEENGQRLVLIVKMIILCGQLRIALCGHRDEGIIDIDTALSGRESNFRALLAFRVDSGDKAFVERWTNTRKKSTYVSKETQNELIKICGEQILEVIVSDVKKAKYFSISGDETTDSFDKEQFCLCIWYVSEDFMLKEEFIGFGAIDLCARSIVSEILERLQKLDLCVADCMGQGYDGALALAGHISGVQALFRQHAPMAVYVHCASHTLNLVLNHKSANKQVLHGLHFTALTCILVIRVAPSDHLATFLLISGGAMPASKYRLIAFCETRFIQRHDVILQFTQNFQEVVDGVHGFKVHEHRCNALMNSSFIVSFAKAKKVMSLTLLLSKMFQAAMNLMNDTQRELKRWRTDDVEWQGTYYAVFNQAECYAEIVGIKLMKPRCSSHQMHSDSEYFKRAIWNSYLDAVVTQISEKFCEKSRSSSKAHGNSLGCHEVLYQELKLYADLRASQKITSTSVLDILREMPSRIENVHRLVQIAATLPVTTYSAERSFSGMKILKSCLRSTMIDDRLNGFAHMYIHKEIPVSVENVITEFALARKQK